MDFRRVSVGLAISLLVSVPVVAADEIRVQGGADDEPPIRVCINDEICIKTHPECSWGFVIVHSIIPPKVGTQFNPECLLTFLPPPPGR